MTMDRSDECVLEEAIFSNQYAEQYVSEMIRRIGIPANIKGYRYLRYGIMLAFEDAAILDKVTKELYPAIARENGTTPSGVERAIRHAIGAAWSRGDGEIEYTEDNFHCHIDFNGAKPTNSQLIALISDCLRLSGTEPEEET